MHGQDGRSVVGEYHQSGFPVAGDLAVGGGIIGSSISWGTRARDGSAPAADAGVCFRRADLGRPNSSVTSSSSRVWMNC